VQLACVKNRSEYQQNNNMKISSLEEQDKEFVACKGILEVDALLVDTLFSILLIGTFWDQHF
jgi:hypothetical protein